MIARSHTARSVVLSATAALGALVLGGCSPTEASRPLSTAAPTTTPAESQAAASAFPDGAASVPSATTTTVTRVIDGDTFEVTGAVKVRVLGIDSCESSTPGGARATGAARAAILGQPVGLTAQPGVDVDRHGRQLRYVSYAGGDFAEMMVRADHTAVYAKGRSDASSAVQARLRSLDAKGRSCGAPASRTATRHPALVGVESSPSATPKPKPSPKPRPAGVAASRHGAPSAPRHVPGAQGAASYANCSAARTAGVAPLYRGQPGYSAKLDRDGDGIACE